MSSEILVKAIPLYQLPLIGKDVLIRDECPGGPPAPLHLAVALDGTGWHPAAWREADAQPLQLLTSYVFFFFFCVRVSFSYVLLF